MTHIDRRAVIAALGTGLVGAASGPAWPENNPTKPAQGGIGGTGIVGTLTDFSSLMVNGLRVETDAQTTITNAYGPAPETALAIGQSLTLEAEARPDGLLARRVHITHPLIGRTEIVDRDAGIFRVAGIEVRLEPGAPAEFDAGARVAISGLWRGSAVVATRIDRLTEDGLSVIAGDIAATTGQSSRSMGGRPVILPPGTEIPEPGTFVTVLGRATGSAFEARTVTPGRFVGAAGPLQRLSVEGYLDPVADAPFFRVSGLGHSFDPEARLAEFADGRSLFDGAYVGTFAVETGIGLPGTTEDRRTLMRAIASGNASGQVKAAR